MRESTSSLTNNNTKYTEMASKTSIDTNNTKKALNLMTNIQEGALIHLCLNPGFELQLLTINFVGFGSHAGFRFHTRRQSFEPSYTQIQALLVFFFSIAFSKKERMNKSIGLLKTFEVSRFYQLQILPSSNLPQLPLGVQCRSFHPLSPPHRFSKVMVSPRSLEVDSKWQHSCDFKYQVLVLCILLLKNTTKKVCNCPDNYLGL